MFFLYSKFIKQKKIIIICLLFFIIFSIIPQKVVADTSGAGIGGALGSLLFGPGGTVVGALTGLFASDKIKEKLGEYGSALFNAIIFAIGGLIMGISVALADFTAALSKAVIAGIIEGGISYTHSPAVNLGWPLVRDLANMVVVLGFVIIGIATILRIQDYEAKKRLPALIIAALLINFSLLICGILIDGSNIAVNHFLETNSLSDYWEKSGVASMVDLTDQILKDPVPLFFLKVVGIGFVSGLSAFVFLLLAFLFLFRIFALWILVILSPLAFVCYVFPFTKSVWQMWWKNFFNWCIIGIPMSFFIYIATELQAKLIDETVTLDTTGLGALARSLTGMFSFLLPGLFLIAGFLVSLQISAMGAGVITGMFSGKGIFAPGKFAGLAGRVTGKPLDKLTGGKLSGAGQAISGGVGRTMERIGLRKTGTTASAKSDRVEKEAKLMAAEYTSAKATGDTATVERIRGWAKNRRGVLGGAAMKVVSDAKDLHKAFADPSDPSGKTTDFNALGARLSYAESVGAKDIKKDTQKLMPELKAYDEPAINEEMQRRNAAGNPLYAQTAAGRAKAAREVVRKQRRSMSVSDIRNMPEPQITADFVEDSNYKTFNRAALEFNTDQHNQAKTLLPELWDRALAAASVSGATPAVRKAAWKAASKAQRSAWLGALSPADREKADDYLRKIAAINR